MTPRTEASRYRTEAEPPMLGGASHSCLREALFESVVSQLLPPPVPAESQQSSFAALVGQGVWGTGAPLSLHFPSLFSASRGPT